MKLTKVLCLSLLAFPFVASAQSSAPVATVRGMLEDSSAKKPLPASGFLVTIEGKNYTSPAVRSGKDGLYYIPNVAPGNYTLKVWADPQSPLSFPITVKGPLTDIPPVVVTPATTAKAKEPAAKPKTDKKAKPAPAPAKPDAVASK
jgi:hypothetical protein